MPSDACSICLFSSLAPCVTSANCALPACAGGTTGAGGTTAGGAGGHVGGTGGAGGFLGGIGGITGTHATCADLQTCCNAITDATMKASCMSDYTAVHASGDAACGEVALLFRLTGSCP